jgi:gluconokinase
MNLQQPLQDEDRSLWLSEIKDDIRRAIDRNREIVMSCSALKAAYREKFTSWRRVQLVWLKTDKSILEQRLETRSKHYMKPEMLASQLATFETPTPAENIIMIDGNQSIAAVVGELIKAVQEYPSMKKTWWERYTAG